MKTTSQDPPEIRGNRLYVGGECQSPRPEAVGTGLALYRTRKGWDGSWRDGVLVIPEEMVRLIVRVERAIAHESQAAARSPMSEPEAAKSALIAAA